MGKGSRGLGKNQRGLRVDCCEMVGDYYGDSSVKENLNLLLRLARVETNVDSKDDEGRGVLEGRLQGSRVLGASTATPGDRRSLREFKARFTRSAHSRVVWRLLEVQGSRENRVDSS